MRRVIFFAPITVPTALRAVQRAHRQRTSETFTLFRDALTQGWRYYGVMIARIYRGTSSFVPPVLTIDNSGLVFQGTFSYGRPIMNIDGDRIYKGGFPAGTPIATVRGNYVYSGAVANSAPVATVEGNKAFKGNNPNGTPIATALDGGKMSAAAAAVYLLLL